jgi:hypothetical protein
MHKNVDHVFGEAMFSLALAAGVCAKKIHPGINRNPMTAIPVLDSFLAPFG